MRFLVNSEEEYNNIKHIVEPIVWNNAVVTWINRAIDNNEKKYNAIQIASFATSSA